MGGTVTDHVDPDAEFPVAVRALADSLTDLADVWYSLAADERGVAARMLVEFADDVRPVLGRVRELRQYVRSGRDIDEFDDTRWLIERAGR